MNTKHSLLAASLLMAMAANASAGPRDWLNNTKAKLQGTKQSEPKELDRVEVRGEKESKPAVDQGKAMEAAGKGCAVGGFIGALAGVDPQLGCAVGGLAGFGWSYKKQVKEAREVEAAAKAAGMDATVSTEQRTDDKGKKQEALAALTIRYEAADMEAMDPKTTATLDKLAALMSKAKNTLTVRFEGTRACQVPLIELQKRGALERHKVDNACGKSKENRIIVTPLPTAH